MQTVETIYGRLGGAAKREPAAQQEVTREGCHYTAEAGMVCNKCGKIHYAVAASPTPRTDATVTWIPAHMDIRVKTQALEHLCRDLERDLAQAVTWMIWMLDHCDDSPEYDFGIPKTREIREFIAAMKEKK